MTPQALYYRSSQGKHPMFTLQISFGQGWQNTCYRPMDRMDADRLADKLSSLYTEYSYRVVPA